MVDYGYISTIIPIFWYNKKARAIDNLKLSLYKLIQLTSITILPYFRKILKGFNKIDKNNDTIMFER